MENIQSQSLEHTLNIGNHLGKLLSPGDVITLSGDLGAGKTTMTKGIAKGLGILAPVSSPTFTIIKEYLEGRMPLYHFDIYRLGESAIDEDLGYDEYFYGNGVCVIEWSEFIDELIPEERLHIAIRHMEEDDQHRVITFSFTDQRWKKVIEELVSICRI
ncbi:tRNA (adenosine(37)-N6)-threonylcarbamoyltransferase complex ATPase subunit type 1 TsaE [Desulfuribacillus stibiiarsenatis]|uniref:tRNA threonylcarbamoyladenosine biosynthesis protein TsaE n=1 Tax=Desulfuribacillus stibiiarsenatis TaxID=1390249 RepID=A0A1E5L5I1_9FIRM|nr:tRNA (adenosine(37)-N6)-threonylcarbamoyltransferase complex ATPase subunit type 1 TsaE [Desulfuribacillus stibiiarsenatis]OEH85229.1 tRNA (adenosine(37)-N6)-threonylcarbamoyltransferase complex ATPase subunit type 1 TsaE [Desulfuribacillus stibiiarsenatis]